MCRTARMPTPDQLRAYPLDFRLMVVREGDRPSVVEIRVRDGRAYTAHSGLEYPLPYCSPDSYSRDPFTEYLMGYCAGQRTVSWSNDDGQIRGIESADVPMGRIPPDQVLAWQGWMDAAMVRPPITWCGDVTHAVIRVTELREILGVAPPQIRPALREIIEDLMS